MDPNKTPALAPPDGVEPSLQDRYPIEGSQIALATVTYALCVVAVVARTYTRAYLLKQFDLIDMTNLLEIFYGPVMLFAKYAILRQIEDIFYKHRPNRNASWAIWGLIWANFLFYLALFLAYVFACTPRSKISDRSIPGYCIDTDASFLARSAINFLSDITILIIPTVAVWQLQLPAKKKLGASVVFAVGILACGAGLARLYYTVRLTQVVDCTWHAVPVTSWAHCSHSLIEFTTGIWVPCFPLIPRLISQLRARDEPKHYELPDSRLHLRDAFSPQSAFGPGDQDSVTHLTQA
ncbi:hypothetical protein F4808DRAFT_468256 [Astrocystis sublimbata]|nr:hypothetical protein F4808DRAFT_468256 [Astrocystis sublimbata]